MATPRTPTGMPKRIRIKLVCYTGIDPIRRFLEFYWMLRKTLRPEYLRRCLIAGTRFGSSTESVLSEPGSSGTVRTILIEILDDDPDLKVFLEKHNSMGAKDLRSLWVRETVLSGHEILSRTVPERIEKKGRAEGAEARNVPEKIQSEDIFGGLFN